MFVRLPLFAALLAGLSLGRTARIDPPPRPDFRADARTIRLGTFFDRYQCPAPYHIGDYLRAADAYQIDYRLLPAISVRETTCGQFSRFNNHWGWKSQRGAFESVPQGIEFVTRQLAQAAPYAGKAPANILGAYNPVSGYVPQVKRLMREIEARP